MYTLILLTSLLSANPEPLPPLTKHLITIKADTFTAANAAALKVWGQRGKDLFKVKYKDGTNGTNPTHYVCYIMATGKDIAAFRKEMQTQITGNKVKLYAKPNAVTKFNELHLTPTNKGT